VSAVLTIKHLMARLKTEVRGDATKVKRLNEVIALTCSDDEKLFRLQRFEVCETEFGNNGRIGEWAAIVTEHSPFGQFWLPSEECKRHLPAINAAVAKWRAGVEA
jgi:hypothetical protein